ncbi:MAG: MarP family serine protease [Actinomycetota bacterium]
MNLLDLLIIGLLVLAAVNGFRRGAGLQLATYVGLLGGLALGALLAPRVARLADTPFSQAALALVVLLLLAALGDGLGWLVGTRIWTLARRSALGTVDSAAGSLLAVVASLLAVWFVGINLVSGPFPAVSREIRGSAVMRTMTDVLPRPPSLLAEVRRFLNRFDFPEVFADLPPPPAGPVKEPSNAAIAAAVDQAERSTVKIVGRACGAIQEGSGFVVAARYVVTNAHVVAGVRDPVVQEQNGPSLRAITVLFDPDLDVAVLRVEGDPGPALHLVPTDQNRGDQGAVLGYPGGGNLTAGAAAIRREIDAVGRDIYGQSTVQRDVYELQATVRPGNSGGPFVDLNGDAAGVVFAASTTDPNVGYALTSSEVIPDVDKAEGRTKPTSTGDCVD